MLVKNIFVVLMYLLQSWSLCRPSLWLDVGSVASGGFAQWSS